MGYGAADGFSAQLPPKADPPTAEVFVVLQFALKGPVITLINSASCLWRGEVNKESSSTNASSDVRRRGGGGCFTPFRLNLDGLTGNFIFLNSKEEICRKVRGQDVRTADSLHFTKRGVLGNVLVAVISVGPGSNR